MEDRLTFHLAYKKNHVIGFKSLFLFIYVYYLFFPDVENVENIQKMQCHLKDSGQFIHY